MCQLLGLSCAEPTDVTFSFTGFAARGGRTDHHVDGWGIAYYEGNACRLFTDDRPAFESPMADFLKQHPIKTRNVIAHIRRATQGTARIDNCHPFVRELHRRHWTFAHNGDLQGIDVMCRGPYAPVGTTDSELAFCIIMNELASKLTKAPNIPDELFEIVEETTRRLTRHGIFNFLLTNGEVQIAYCSTRLSYVLRKWPFSKARLIDEELSVDFSAHGSPADRTAVIATKPLTDEAWTTCRSGDLMLFHGGLLKRKSNLPVPREILEKAKFAPSELSLPNDTA